MNNKKNLITSIIFQIATIFQGLIIPRLIIYSFGSEVNGLLSSITQFLSFIALLEGGLGAVVLAELYLPIQQKNKGLIREILFSCQNFFTKLAKLFLVYTLMVSVIYPLFFYNNKSFAFVSSLVWILSITTLAQYLFSITYKLYLQASQKLYIVNIVSTLIIIINIISTLVLVFVFPQIHLMKLLASVMFFIQPIIFSRYIDSEFKLSNVKNIKTDFVLKNRWSGFAQNLAYFINVNTDIFLITCFLGMNEVSVYMVYSLAINALKSIAITIGNSYQSAFGKLYAEGNVNILSEKFKKFEDFYWFFGITVFSTCLLLINPFVKLYVDGINDINYFYPGFAIVIVFANMIYVIREPYRLLVLSAGKFKETNFGSIIEAILNISISMVLIIKFGLLGVAIGTLIAILYRLLYFIAFLHHQIIYRRYKDYLKYFLTFIIMFILNFVIYKYFAIFTLNFIEFILLGIVVLLSEIVMYIVVSFSISRLILLFSRFNY